MFGDPPIPPVRNGIKTANNMIGKKIISINDVAMLLWYDSVAVEFVNPPNSWCSE